MKKESNLTLGIGETEKVNQYFVNFSHPLVELIQETRKLILKIDLQIGEGIYWNVPTFYYTGELEKFDPKTYKRFIVNFNFYQKDNLRLILLKGADLIDPAKILEGNYEDGRRIIKIKDIEDLKMKESELNRIILQILEKIKA